MFVVQTEARARDDGSNYYINRQKQLHVCGSISRLSTLQFSCTLIENSGIHSSNYTNNMKPNIIQLFFIFVYSRTPLKGHH